MKVMLEKRSGKRVEIIKVNDDKTVYKFVGDDKEKSLKTLMFTKLFRELEEGENPEQLTEEELVAYKTAKTAVKAEKSTEAAQKREEAKAAREKALAERRASLQDENVELKVYDGFSPRNNIAITVEVNEKFKFISEITPSGKISFAWLEDDKGEEIKEFNNKGIATVAPWIAEKLGLKPEALAFMMKEARKNAISDCKISADDVAKAKAEAKAKKEAAAAAVLKQKAEANAKKEADAKAKKEAEAAKNEQLELSDSGEKK